MRQLGGNSINLNPSETQMGRGEPIEDSARVISSMVDGVMIRTDAHNKITTFADYSSVPVINGLTDDYHPLSIAGRPTDLIRAKGWLSRLYHRLGR